MKKIVSITLAGKMYYFEEDAFRAISSVLDKQIKKKQLEKDISSAIDRKLNDLKTVVTYADIMEILSQLSDNIDFDYHYSTNSQNYKRLYRSRSKRILGGVCGGIADYLNTDVVLIRALFLLAVFFAGGGILVYLILWLVIPEES